jgi:FkbM family methyltransferase
MQVEECCEALLAELLPSIDENRYGITIEIGVGSFAFYCELFAKCGFRSIAVEPLPTKHLREICRARGIELIESCVSEVEGNVDLYVGTFDGSENTNLNSMRSDWWGVTGEKRIVPSMRLLTLVQRINAPKITCLKIDVEGLELAIIKQLSLLPPEYVPSVIMFEYGGGGSLASGKGGWSQELLMGTMSCLEILRDFGFRQIIQIDSLEGSIARACDLQSTPIEPEAFFDKGNTYGNFIGLKEFSLSSEKIAELSAAYRSAPPKTKRANSNFLQSTVQRLKRVIGS